MSAPTGYWGMKCWNALNDEQQQTLITIGVLPIDRKQPEGDKCKEWATCEVETEDDESPGPRFYCYVCAQNYLHECEVEKERKEQMGE